MTSARSRCFAWGIVVACALGRSSAQEARPASARPAPGVPAIDEKGRTQPWALASIKLPKFPDLPAPQTLEAGILLYDLTLAWDRGPSRLWLYLPAGEHAKKSLSCVFVAPAGSNLLFGMDLGDGDRVEHLPYVKAGFAVMAYEIEGVLPPEEKRSDDEIWAAARRYQASCAGLADARAAIEYVLAKVPSVDPQKLFTAGHSSAGTMALLFAAHEPRLKGCAAYAPIVDARKHATEEIITSSEPYLPGLGNFLVKSSPCTHEARLAGPLFLFQAEDDSRVAFADTKSFVERLRVAGRKVTFETVPTGDHYDPMIATGIPKAIEWMQALAAAPPAKPASPKKGS